MAKNPLDPHLSENAFAKAESGMKIDKIGNGSFAFDLHGPSSRPRSGRIQTPAQHASVKKAAAASVAKRRARSFGI
jgi:hypothetical protein